MSTRTAHKFTYTCETCGNRFEKEVKNVVDSLPYCSQQCWMKAKTIKAAATDLLASCRELLNNLGNFEVLGEWSALDRNRKSQKDMRAKIDAIEVRARAAIAKAEGRAP